MIGTPRQSWSSLRWDRRDERRIRRLQQVDDGWRMVVRIRSWALPAARVEREAVGAIGYAVSIRVGVERIRSTRDLDGIGHTVTVHVRVRRADPRPYGGAIRNAVAVRVRLSAVRAQREFFHIREPVTVGIDGPQVESREPEIRDWLRRGVRARGAVAEGTHIVLAPSPQSPVLAHGCGVTRESLGRNGHRATEQGGSGRGMRVAGPITEFSPTVPAPGHQSLILFERDAVVRAGTDRGHAAQIRNCGRPPDVGRTSIAELTAAVEAPGQDRSVRLETVRMEHPCCASDDALGDCGRRGATGVGSVSQLALLVVAPGPDRAGRHAIRLDDETEVVAAFTYRRHTCEPGDLHWYRTVVVHAAGTPSPHRTVTLESEAVVAPGGDGDHVRQVQDLHRGLAVAE